MIYYYIKVSNVAHWREKFLGEYGYHLFVHFVNLNGHLIDMPFINDYKEEILPEEIQNRRDHFSKEYNPWSLDEDQVDITR